MKIEHYVRLVAEFNEDTTPASYLAIFRNMSANEIQDLLEKVFIGAADNANLLETINENNKFATIKWGAE